MRTNSDREISRRCWLKSVVATGAVGVAGCNELNEWTKQTSPSDPSNTAMVKVEDVYTNPIPDATTLAVAYNLKISAEESESTGNLSHARILDTTATDNDGLAKLSIPEPPTTIDDAEITADIPVVLIATYRDRSVGTTDDPESWLQLPWFGSTTGPIDDITDDQRTIQLLSKQVMLTDTMSTDQAQGSDPLAEVTAWKEVNPDIPEDPRQRYDDSTPYTTLNIETRGTYVPPERTDSWRISYLRAGRLALRASESVDLFHDNPGLQNQLLHRPRWIHARNLSKGQQTRGALMNTLNEHFGGPLYGLLDNNIADDVPDGLFSQYTFKPDNEINEPLAFGLAVGQAEAAALSIATALLSVTGFTTPFGLAATLFVLGEGLSAGLSILRGNPPRNDLQDDVVTMLGNSALPPFDPNSFDQIPINWRRRAFAVTHRLPVSFNEDRLHRFGAVGLIDAEFSLEREPRAALVDHAFGIDPANVSPVVQETDTPTPQGPSTPTPTERLQKIRRPPPFADFAASTWDISPGDTVTFDGSPSEARTTGETIEAYEWTIIPPSGPFGEGEAKSRFTKRGKEAEILFGKRGTYDILLRVHDSLGQTDQASAELPVKPNVLGVSEVIANDQPTAQIKPDSISMTTGASVTFDGSGSSDPNGDALSYTWKFYEKGSQNPYARDSGTQTTETYNESGDYTVELIVEDEDGATDTAFADVSVSEPNEQPTARIEPTSVTIEASESVTFDGSDSSDPEGDSLSYTWKFYEKGSQNPYARDSGPTTTETYNESGDYTVELIVEDEDGATDTAFADVSVSEPNEQPTARIEPTSVTIEAGESVTFDGSDSSDPDSDSLSYTWKFYEKGSQNPYARDSGSQTTETYNESGDYSVELVVEDEHGATDNGFASVSVSDNDPPTAAISISPDPAEVNETVTFDGSDSSDDRGIDGYSWTFYKQPSNNQIGTASGEVVSRSFGDEGTYAAELTVTDTDGATDSETDSFEVQ